MTVSGGIQTFRNVKEILTGGAGKVNINSKTGRKPEFIN